MKTKSTRNIHKITSILVFVSTIFFGASIDTSETGTTIAYIGDAEIFGASGIPELTKDFNQIIPQSPTGKVDAVVMLGDMDLAAQAMQAYSNSTAKDIPIFYVPGNHDSQNIYDTNMLKTIFENSLIPLNPGPSGTDKSTYSFDIGRLHIINMNEYWDGNYNGVCDWKIPEGGVSLDDTCFKYSTGDGGYVPDGLLSWINDDLAKTSQPWKIVIGHEPLYPLVYHVGNSLDRNKINRDKLQSLFVTQKVAVFLSGHTHTSGVQFKDGIYHAGAGVTGLATTKGEDPFASLFYTHINQANDLILTWKHENPNWNTPITASYTIKNAMPSSNSLLNITSFTPLSPVNDKVGATQTFRITANQTVNLKWYINGTQVGSNSSVTGGNYSNTSAKSGTWNLTAVADNSNGSAANTWIWKVSDVIADAGGPYAGTPGIRINFTGSASGGTAPYSHKWDFGDGGTSNLANPGHVYSNKGSYTASFTVTDSEGRISSPDTAPVSVALERFINGTIFDNVTKTGISGVIVYTNTSLSTITNPDGFYSFPVNSGIYKITAVFDPEYYSNSTTVSTEFTGFVVQDIVLLEKPVGTIKGAVKIG